MMSFLVDDIWYAEFAKNGYVLDVTDRLDENTQDQHLRRRWDITTVDGKTYGMPWLMDEKYFFYNEEMLKEAGFDTPPATWEELLDPGQGHEGKGHC